MNMINKLTRVYKNNGKSLFEIVSIEPTNFTEVLLPVTKYTTETLPAGTIKDNTLEVLDVATDFMDSLKGYKENLTCKASVMSLIDILRKNEIKLLIIKSKLTELTTNNGTLTEIPNSYIANMANVKYSSKHASVSVPYVIKMKLQSDSPIYDGTITDKIISKSIISGDGHANKRISAIMTASEYEGMKTELLPYTHTVVSDISKQSDNIIVNFNLADLPVTSSTKYINAILKLPEYIYYSIATYNDASYRLKGLRNALSLFKSVLAENASYVEDEDIFKFSEYEEQFKETELQFYIAGTKQLKSFNKVAEEECGDKDALLAILLKMIKCNNVIELNQMVSNVPKVKHVVILSFFSVLKTLDFNIKELLARLIKSVDTLNAQIKALENTRHIIKARLNIIRLDLINRTDWCQLDNGTVKGIIYLVGDKKIMIERRD